MSLLQQLQQAKDYLKRDKLHLASELFEKILYEDSENIDALVGMAKISLLMDLTEDAQNFAMKALDVKGDYPETWLILGLIMEEKDLEKSLEYLKMALDLQPDSALFNYQLSRVLAKAHYIEDALIPLRVALKKVPNDIDALMLQGRIYRDLDAQKDAILSFQKVIQHDERHLPAYLELIELLVLEGEFELALEVIVEARRSCGSNLMLDTKESELQAFVGNWDRAAELMEFIIKRQPDSTQAWLNMGVFQLLQEDFEGAEKAFWKAQATDETHWEPWFFLGELYEASELPQKAEESYRQALELNPNEWKILNNLALLIMHEDENLTKEAINLLQGAIALHPDNEAPIINLALACFKAHDYKTASKLTIALDEFPSLPLNIQTMLKNLKEELQKVGMPQ